MTRRSSHCLPKTAFGTYAALVTLGLAALFALAACVWRTEHKVETVHRIDAHIVLDIRQVREQAAQVEDYVRGDATQPPPAAQESKPTSRALTDKDPSTLAAAPRRAWWSLLDPAGSAWAEDAPAAKVTPEEKRKAIEARKARRDLVEKGLNAGALGENDHGYLEILGTEQNPTRAREYGNLTREENRDRRTIYLALAQSSSAGAAGLPKVEMVYAGEIRRALKPGQSFQVPRDKEFFEEFQKSELGKKHASAKPGEWRKK